MVDNFTQLTVGDKVCNPCPESTLFDLVDGGAIMLIKMRSPTNREQRAVNTGTTQFRFVVVDDIIFFLAKFGVLNWMDAPYYAKISNYHIDPPKAPLGLSLHVMLIDAKTGVLAAQRLIGLDTTFSCTLLAAAERQPEIPDYPSHVARAMSRYTTRDLLVISGLSTFTF